MNPTITVYGSSKWSRAAPPVSAYLLDGVLCDAPPPCWRPYAEMRAAERLHRRAELLTHYRNAEPTFAPPESSFVVLSLRRDDVAVRHVTTLWLARAFTRRVRSLVFLPYANTPGIAARARMAALVHFGAREYTDDSARVLTSLARLMPSVRLWLWDGEHRSGIRVG